MICHDRKSLSTEGAYTFFEVALALGIIAVVFAAMLPMISAGFKERRLRDGMESIGQLVRDLRLQAEKTDSEQILVVQAGALALREKEHLFPRVQIPPGATLSVRYPAGEWTRANDQEWRIFSSGLVAPMSLRLQDGGAWIESDFDFLTGSVSQERYSF